MWRCARLSPFSASRSYEVERGNSRSPAMSEWILCIFDSSVLIDDLRTGRHQQRIQSVTALIRTSSVVLAELWRGANNTGRAEIPAGVGRTIRPDSNRKELA